MPVAHRLLAVLAASLVGLTPARAEPPAKADPRVILDDAALLQAQLKRQFETFKQKLAVLAGRLENGSAADKEKAKSLRAALELAGERGVDGRFDALIRGLRTRGADANIDVLAAVLKENEELRRDLKALIALLSSQDRDQQLRQRCEAAQRLVDQIKEVRSRQARLQALTERGKLGTEELKKNQEKLTNQTREVLKPQDGKPGGEPSDLNKAAETEAQREAVRKPVEEAIRRQEEAQRQLGGGNAEDASEAQGGAVARLDEAIRRLEEILHVCRVEEKERLLADLLARCERMLALQTQVRDGTTELDREISKSKDKKPTVAHAARANTLADVQDASLKEADATLKVLESEGSAVAFTEVFQQMRQDMQTVRFRLSRTDTGKVTVTIESDIVETLKDMIRALKKNRAEKDSDLPPPRDPGGDGPSPKRKLIDLLNELKMLHAQQARVNSRTALYGLRFKGEQVPPPGVGTSADDRAKLDAVRQELADLADRQQRLGKVTRDLARNLASKEGK